MPIVTLQRRSRELGRIRIGQQVNTGRTKDNGDPIFRPAKLDRFRLTSASKPLLEKVAKLYGGEVVDWNNNGSPQFEVITTATRLPILVPPQAVSQYFELWAGRTCRRRCDGETELLKDKPCICSLDPSERECKPTTRLNVILRDVEGIGVWRLESHGYYSATELPEVADFVARAGSYAPAWLALEERTVVRDNKTRRWMVPTIEVDITPAALLAGGQAKLALPAAEKPDEIAEWVASLDTAQNIDDLGERWRHRPAETLPDDAVKAFRARAAELRAREDQPESMAPEAIEAPQSDELAALWMEALGAAPEDWSVTDVEAHFTEITGLDHKTATAEDMRHYLDTVYPATVEQADGAA